MKAWWIVSLFYASISVSLPALSGQIDDEGLYRAAEKCDAELTQIQLKKGANPNRLLKNPFLEGKARQTSLMLAIRTASVNKLEECLPTIKLLIAGGADSNIQNELGESAVFYAVPWSVWPEIAELLAENGARLNQPMHVKEKTTKLMTLAIPNQIWSMNEGKTPLMKLAVEFQLEQALRYKGNEAHDWARRKLDFLIKHSEINARDISGQTALMLATQHRFIEVAKVLLEKGALLDIKDKSGKTALDYAIQGGDTALVKLLMN